MKESIQDSYYLSTEGDQFFDRSIKSKATKELRKNKQEILNFIQNALGDKKIDNILEYGCNYGDLINYFSNIENINAYGIEASQKAVEHGKALFGDDINIFQGTIANNQINQDNKYTGFFDLIIIEDVFGWVSRETLFQSIANIDNVLKDGGIIFIRDFYMNQRIKNKNIHIDDEDIFCYKLADGYSKIFIDTGLYEIVSQKIWNDSSLQLTDKFKSAREFENRWSDTIIKKSFNNYYI